MEKQYLARALAGLDWEKEHINRRFAEGISAGDAAAEESVAQILERRFQQLLLVDKQPYFARIDFGGSPTYLGKTTITDSELNLIVADWRAPIASVYYEHRLGDAYYDCPDGRITGELTLKRQFVIQDRELIKYDDVDITSDDELLVPYLRVSSDARLKNIIATIQGEQNAIIRSPIGKNLIVQGAAGSGKTTVALHRVAWIVYTYAKQFSPKRLLILAPNRLFLNYIADILPDLGVEDVPQETFEALVRRVAKITVTPRDPILFLERVISGEADTARAAYKMSLQCRKDLDAFLKPTDKTRKPIDIYREFIGGAGGEKLEYEDLTPLLYIWWRHNGTTADMRRVRHILIDEAQDYGLFQLSVLKDMFPNATFTILGDLAQSLFGYRGITDWESVNEAVFGGSVEIGKLRKSYRTTIEIMEYAAKLLDVGEGERPEAVIRHGEPVREHEAENVGEMAQIIAKIVKNRASEHKNIAIIARTAGAAKGLSKMLRADFDFKLLDGKDDYTGGVSLLSAAQSKGLEFDAVIIADFFGGGEDKLKYVACTRAMHTLDIVCQKG